MFFVVSTTMAPASSFLVPTITTSRRCFLPHFSTLALALLPHREHNRAWGAPKLSEPLEWRVEDGNGLRRSLPNIGERLQFGEGVLLGGRCRRRGWWRRLHGRKWRRRRARESRHGWEETGIDGWGERGERWQLLVSSPVSRWGSLRWLHWRRGTPLDGWWTTHVAKVPSTSNHSNWSWTEWWGTGGEEYLLLTSLR